MKETLIFIGSWIATWLLFTAIGWFATPGAEFRELSGHCGIVTITLVLGWAPGVFILAEMENKGKL